MHESRPSDKLELPPHPGQNEQPICLHRVGPSNQGWIYRTDARDACYRLLPIRRAEAGRFVRARRSDDAPVPRRHKFQAWLTTPAARSSKGPAWLLDPVKSHLAPIEAAYQRTVDSVPWWFVQYRMKFQHSLAELPDVKDPYMRLDRIVRVLRCIPQWWAVLYRGLIPMPADIVFGDNGEPFLLPAPFWRYPDTESIFTEPSRGLHLAPEYVRGLTVSSAYQVGLGIEAIDYDMDRYAFGAAFLQCLYKAPAAQSAQAVLSRAAHGLLWTGLESTLPFWLQDLSPTQEALEMLRRMVDPDPKVRSGLGPAELADRLHRCRDRMQPRVAIQELLAQDRAEKAHTLLQDVLLFQDTFDMLLEAAEVALRCFRPLEAVDLCERAIEKAPERLEAYERQFRILLGEETRSHLIPLLRIRSDAGDRLDEKVWRDFMKMEAVARDAELQMAGYQAGWWDSENTAARDAELQMAGYLLWRRGPMDAACFIYSRLVPQPGHYLWMKFRLRLLYVEVLFACQRGQEARRELVTISNDLRYAYEQNWIAADELDFCSDRWCELDRQLSDAGFFAPPSR